MNKLSLGDESTIYALSTAAGRAAIAVIRVSGPACTKIYESLCPHSPPLKPRLAAVRTLYNPTEQPSRNTVLDSKALLFFFLGPKTATGEDILELHLHGGPAIVKAVLTAISHIDGAATRRIRYAEPGEFTRRAFLNGRLDLPQIEALSDTLSADTEQQRRLAVRGASDALSKRYESWRKQLLYARGELEALIDFSEDQHFDESSDELVASVASQVRVLQRQIALHIQNASKGELLRNGIKVALLGAPNAGKSSLLNQIAGKEAAIVSPEEGTTRDVVDVGVDIGGWYCRLGDTAGIRPDKAASTSQGTVVIGMVEKEGIRRAKARALESDVVVVVVSVEDGVHEQGYCLSVQREVLEAAKECMEAGKFILVAINKCDKLRTTSQVSVPKDATDSLVKTVHKAFQVVPEDRIFTISCREAQDLLSPQRTDPGNIQQFLRGLITTFEKIASPLGMDSDESREYDISYWRDSLGVTHRQSSNLQQCMHHLDDFLGLAPPLDPPTTSSNEEGQSDVDIVTAAEHLRFAADALAKITGKGENGDVEDVLGVVFEKFCVGK